MLRYSLIVLMTWASMMTWLFVLSNLPLSYSFLYYFNGWCPPRDKNKRHNARHGPCHHTVQCNNAGFLQIISNRCTKDTIPNRKILTGYENETLHSQWKTHTSDIRIIYLHTNTIPVTRTSKNISDKNHAPGIELYFNPHGVRYIQVLL